MSTDVKLTPRTLGGLPIRKAGERKNTRFMNALIYGDAGVGKTVLLGSADAVAAMRPVGIIMLEGGDMSLWQRYPEVDIIEVDSWQRMQQIYDEIRLGKGGYRTVGLDSLSEMQQLSMETIMTDLEKVGRKGGGEVDKDIPSMKEWGKNSAQLRRFVRAFRDLPMNTIFTAHAKQVKRGPKESDPSDTFPSLPGKLAKEVAGFVDIVTYMYVKKVGDETSRLCLTGYIENIMAKDRTDMLPEVMINPTMEDFYKAAFTLTENG